MNDFVGGSLVVIGGLAVVLLAVVARQLQEIASTLSLQLWRQPDPPPARREPVECPVCAAFVTPDVDLTCPRCASRVAPF